MSTHAPPFSVSISFIVFWLVSSWFIASWLLGWLLLPATRRVFALPDGGLAAGRVLGLALVSLAAFWLSSLRVVPLSIAPPLLVFTPLATAVCSLRSASRRREFGVWARANRRALGFSDAIFALAFCGFLWLRMRHPELNDLEKPMDAALLGTLARASFLPAGDPWFGGAAFTNYYYFGPLMASLPARLFATPGMVAYNIVQPLWCALFLSTLWSLCAALCRLPGCDTRFDDGITGQTAKHVLRSRRNSKSDAARGASLRGASLEVAARPTFREPFAPGDTDYHVPNDNPASLWRGVVAMAIVGLLGNFEPARQMTQTGHIWPLDWWATTRVITDTINEYPFFTMTIGDLHAHFYALPLQTLFLGLCHALVTHDAAPHDTSRDASSHDATTASRTVIVFFLGLILGVLAMTNTWDVPVFSVLAICCALRSMRESHRTTPIASSEIPCSPHDAPVKRAIRDDAFSSREATGRVPLAAIAQAFAPLPIALLVAWPYFSRFQSPVHGVARELWLPHDGSFFLLWGGFLALWTALLWREYKARRTQAPRETKPNQPRTSGARMSTHVGGTASVLSFAVAARLGVLSLWAVLALCGAVLWALWSRALSAVEDQNEALASSRGDENRDTGSGDMGSGKANDGKASGRAALNHQVLMCDAGEKRVASFWLLLGLAGALALGAPLFFYIRGAFGDGQWRHQDTVFKFGLQAWLLLGVGASCFLVSWWSRASRGWKIASVLAFLPFPLLCSACVVWTRAFRDAPRDGNGNIVLSLDGARGLPTEDRAAIEWLRVNAREGETVLEAVGDDYSEFARVSALSGVATPLGWTQHVEGWGAPQEEIANRRRLIWVVFAWPDDATARAALKALGVRYVFVGELEHRTYNLAALARLRAALPVTYANGTTFIARMP